MAVQDVKGQNVTKHDAGGSGDNYIPDGYIKSVEKIWMDNYTLTSVITLTNTSIMIARIPPNKKITSIELMIETSISQTNGTISLGHSGDSDAFVPAVVVTHNLTLSTIGFPSGGSVGSVVAPTPLATKMAGLQLVTSGTTGNICLKLNNWTMSTGTVKSIVRYV